MPAPSRAVALRRALTEGPVTPAVRAAWGAAGLGLFFALYGGIGLLTAGAAGTAHLLPLPVDGWIPLTPAATLAYLALYPAVLAPLALAEDRRLLLRGAAIYLGMLMLSAPVWILAPVTVPRTPVPVEDLFTWGLWITRTIDPPTNCFPSMHVAESFAAARLLARCDRGLGRVLLGVAVLIWWSTLALDQHWFADGVAGLLVALLVERVVFAQWPPGPGALRIGPRSRMVWMVALYVALVVAAGIPWWAGWVDPGALPAPRW